VLWADDSEALGRHGCWQQRHRSSMLPPSSGRRAPSSGGSRRRRRADVLGDDGDGEIPDEAVCLHRVIYTDNSCKGWQVFINALLWFFLCFYLLRENSIRLFEQVKEKLITNSMHIPSKELLLRPLSWIDKPLVTKLRIIASFFFP